MACLFQTVCLLLLVGIVHNWGFPWAYEQPIPVTFVRTSIEGAPSSSSLFNEMDRIMASMHHQFDRMFGWPVYRWDDEDDEQDRWWLDDEERLNPVDPSVIEEYKPSSDRVNHGLDIQSRLDGMEPVCTTWTDTTTTISPRKSRRKKLRGTQTKTCVRELIIDGQKHFSEEITTTDEKGVIVKHSKAYGNMPVSMMENKTMAAAEH